MSDDAAQHIVSDITDTLELLANGEPIEHRDQDWLEVQMGAFLFLSKPIPPLSEVQVTGPDPRDTL
jgi:hypothetical protein